MKRYLILVFVLIIHTLKLGSQTTLKYDYGTILSTDGYSQNNLNRTQYLADGENSIYLIVFSSTNQLKVTHINYKINKSKTYQIEIPKRHHRKYFQNFDPVFTLQNDTIIGKYGDNILMFSKNKNAEFEFLDVISFENKTGTKITSNNQHYIAYGIYNYHRKSDHKKSSIILKDKSTLKETIYEPKFDFPEYTILAPTHYISILNNIYAVSQSIDYKIHFYNEKFKLKDSIVYNNSDVFPLLDKEEVKKYEGKEIVESNPKAFISDFQTLLTKGSRIWNIQLLDTSTIFVRFSVPDGKRFKIRDQVWHYNEDSWSIINNVDQSTYKKDTIIDSSNAWPLWYTGTNMTVHAGKLYYFIWSSSEDLIDVKMNKVFEKDMSQEKLKLKLMIFSVQ
ncbi:MAG: hypothetical protein COA32_05400 [Fluviicola sp.]|nr:MAG: hypothetical protein COA32_05400 [Fluviicola sp.]